MSEDSELTESVVEDGTKCPPATSRRTRRRRARRTGSRERPNTATLLHPNVLDETLKDKVDMTLTKKDLLAAVKLCTEFNSATGSTSATRTASNLARLRRLRQHSSNDETGSSSESVEQIYLPPRPRRSNKTKMKLGGTRPSTSRLDRPSSDLDVPNIRYYSKPKSMKARMNHKMKTEARRRLFALQQDAVPEPCMSCGRVDQPERFHTHPPATHPPAPQPAVPQSAAPPTAKQTKIPVRQQSPLKEIKVDNNNVKSKDQEVVAETADVKEKEKLGVGRSRRNVRSHSPQKSVSPVGDQRSPQMRRKRDTQKHGDSVQDTSPQRQDKSPHGQDKSPQRQDKSPHRQDKSPHRQDKSPHRPDKIAHAQDKSGHGQDKSPHKSKHKSDSGEFTVDIFTTSSLLARSQEELRDPPDQQSGSKHGEAAVAGKHEAKDKDDPESRDGVAGHSVRPVAVKCKTCGKEFGRASIKFHEPQCQKKRKAEEAKKEQDRIAKEDQDKPVSYMDHLAGDEFNETFDAIWEAHVQQLIPCSMCGRTFFPDRIEVHQRSCKGKAKPKDGSTITLREVKTSHGLPTRARDAKTRDIPIQYFISK